MSHPELGPANWSRRYKTNVERLRSGDRSQIAEVVRQLSEREQAIGISQGERRMLARARQMLDDPGDDAAGVREPRRPFPPNDTISSVASESDPIRDWTIRTSQGTVSPLPLPAQLEKHWPAVLVPAVSPPVGHEIDEAKTAPFLGKMILWEGHRRLACPWVVDIYSDRRWAAANGHIEGSAVAGRRVHDSVGRHLWGEQDSFVQDGYWAEYQPDEFADAGNLITATPERSPDGYRITVR